MKISLLVNYNDGTTKSIDAVFADFIAFERTWQRSVARFETEVRLTDMAWLIAPAGITGRAGQAAGLTEKVAQGAGLVGTSFIQTREDYYQEGKNAGLKGDALDNFATGAAGLTSALEAVFPNTIALGGFKSKLAKDYAKQIASGITTKAALKAGVKEILKEAVVFLCRLAQTELSVGHSETQEL